MRKVSLITAIVFWSTIALSQMSGVLLGLASTQTMEHDRSGDPQYRTLWIAPDGNGQLKVLSTLPELVVPRRDGFWHAGVKEVCEFADANEDRLQIPWAAPFGKPGIVERNEPSCTPHKPEDYAGTYMRSDEDQDKISQCGLGWARIEYLSPELMAVSDYSTESEDCEPRGGHYTKTYYVRNLELNQPLKFGQLLGDKAEDAYADSIPPHSKNDMDEVDCGEGAVDDADTGWRIAHKLGRWRPYMNQSLGMFGCAVDAPIAFPLPVAMTGDPMHEPDWKLLRARVLGVDDVYFSPSGDLLIATGQGKLRFYAAANGVPGALLLTLPAQQIVMAQWATGKHVLDWTTMLAQMAGQRPVAPDIKVKRPNH